MKQYLLALAVVQLVWVAGCTREQAQPARILLIGDSISIGYTPFVVAQLPDAQVFHNSGNAKHSRFGAAELDAWLGPDRWDVVHFNFGLWDLIRRAGDMSGDPCSLELAPFIPLEEYESNLRQIVQRIKATGAKALFATTTAVPDGNPCRLNADVLAYNAVAVSVMQEHGVPITDLYTASLALESFRVAPTDVHFTSEGYEYLAAAVSVAIDQSI